MFTYKHPRPAVTVDVIVFRNKMSEVLLIKRLHDPFEGRWALPGGFMDMDETLEEAAVRELEEETGLSGIELKQLHAFSALDRDPRHRTVSVAFYGVLENDQVLARAGSDAKEAEWFKLNDMPPLAFDHDRIMEVVQLSHSLK
jgi:8-oxo-dGTP diphosphatase